MGEYLVDVKNERLSFFTPAGEVKALNDVSIHLKEDMFCEKIAFIETAAKQYGSGIYEPGMDVELTVAELVKLGALKKDQDVYGSYVLDPRDNSSMDAIKVKIYAKNKRAYAHVEVDQSMCES